MRNKEKLMQKKCRDKGLFEKFDYLKELVLNQKLETSMLVKNSIESSLLFKDNELYLMEMSETCKQSIRVRVNGREGIVFVTGIHDVEKLLREARMLTANGKKIPYPMANRAEGLCPEFCFTDKKRDEFCTEALVELVSSIQRYISGKLKRVKVSILLDNESVVRGFFCSSGVASLEISDTIGGFITLSRVIKDDTLEYCFPILSHNLGAPFESWIDSHLELFSIMQKPDPITQGKYSAIIHPNAINSLLFIVFESLFAANIHKGSSYLTGKLGEQVLSSQLTLSDEPVRESSSCKIGFDDEGSQCKDVVFFRNGVFEKFLLNREYSFLMGLDNNGRGFNLSGDGTEEINPGIEPGQVSLEEMIRSVDQGVLVLYCWDIDNGSFLNGDFSGGVQGALHIRNGRLTGRIKDSQISGNIYEMLGQSLAGISTQREIEISGSGIYPYLLIHGIDFV